MADPRPILVVGPGAVGGLLAASLLRSGRPVALLCRDAAQAAALRRSGLSVRGATTARLPGRRFAAIAHLASSLGPVRAVFFCVKSYDAQRALSACRAPAASSDAAVSLQNGLDHVRPMRRALGARAVFGVGFFAAFREGPGRVRHAGGLRIALSGAGAPVETARELLAAAGWKVSVHPSTEELLWTKLVLNAAVNPLAALAGTENGMLALTPPLADLLGRAAAEGEGVLKALRIRPTESPLPNAALRLCRETAGNVNSMLADLRAGRRTEAVSILRPLVEAARRARTPAPVLESLYRLVRGLEREVRVG